MSRTRICIVSHAAYGALTGGSGHIGGVERQTSFLAKWLAARGHAVDFVTWAPESVSDREDENDASEDRVVDGVRLLTICRQDEGVRGIRFVHPRWSSLVGALRRSNADVYYHNTAEVVTGQVGLWCRLNRRRFVFSSASHADCDPSLPCLPTWRERVLFRIGLRCATSIVVQTGTQQRMMRAGFGCVSQVIPMPCPEPDPESVLRPAVGPLSTRVLWVGRLCPEKRPQLLLDVARHAPDLQFDLVGPVDGVDFGREILRQAEQLPNVTYHGAVLPAAMTARYRQAACLLCTSHIEGFPNTFLEAWSLGLPVVSTWDPDDIVERRGLGVVSESTPSGVAAAIRSLIDSPARWSRASSHGRAYYVTTHRPELTFGAFERILVGEPSARVSTPIDAAPSESRY